MARAIALTIIFEAAVLYLNQGRGIPWIFGLFVACVMILNYALKRTKWGRSMFAVGGNREAARRSGINVRAIYVSAFVLCTTLATFGGILAASRLASASQQAGTGDVNLNAIAAAVIGGTSLFGGRGSAWSAIGDHRDSVDFKWADAVEPAVFAALYHYRRGTGDCGNH